MDTSYVAHGFVRAPGSTLTEFDVESPSYGTAADSINPAGAIAGVYTDASSVNHGFLRAPDGTFTTFDAPHAGEGFGQGTYPQNINPAGAIGKYHVDERNVNHGFVRSPHGGFTTFDVHAAMFSAAILLLNLVPRLPLYIVLFIW